MTQSTEQERAEFEAWLNPEYSKELDGTGSYIDDTVYSMFAAWQAGRRAPVVPQCPFPCGWKNLHKLVVAEGAFLAKSLNECEPITTHQRDVVMRVVNYGIEMARSMLAAAPQPPEATVKQQLTVEAAPVQLPEPAAWRYTDARGHYRYRGARPGFAVEYPLLKPEALYTEQQVLAILVQHGIKTK